MATSLVLRPLRTLGLTVCVLAVTSLAQAQQIGGTSGNSSSGSSNSSGASSTSSLTVTDGPAATQAAAANAGSQLSNQNLFTSTDQGAGVGALGSNSGRFATSALQNAPTATGTGQTTTAGGRNTNQFGGGQNARGGNNNNRNRFGQQGAARPTIRPALRLGFVPPPRPSADVTRAVERRFDTLSSRTARLADTVPAFRGVSIDVGDAGKVTLTGEVASAEAARLAANILRMEAGVRSVQNDLTVAAR